MPLDAGKKEKLVLKSVLNIAKLPWKSALSNVRRCIKFGEYNVGESDGILTLPYYLVFMLAD